MYTLPILAILRLWSLGKTWIFYWRQWTIGPHIPPRNKELRVWMEKSSTVEFEETLTYLEVLATIITKIYCSLQNLWCLPNILWCTLVNSKSEFDLPQTANDEWKDEEVKGPQSIGCIDHVVIHRVFPFVLCPSLVNKPTRKENSNHCDNQSEVENESS